MTDDVTLPGTGDVVAADDVSGVKYQRVKLDIGGDGVSSPVVSGNPLPVSGTVTANAGTNLNTSALALESGGNLAAIATDAAAIEALLTTIDADTSRIPALGQATMAASAPVVIASNQSAVPVSGPLTDTELRATAVPVSLASVPSHAVTNAGTFAVQESGAALTALQLIDDAVATTASAIPGKGLAISGTDGTNARVVKVDTNGELQVDVLTLPNVTVGAALPSGSNQIGGVNVSQINGVTPLMGAGNTGTGSPRVTIASDQAAIPTTPAGGVAHDGADSGNPLKVGARAINAEIAAVANNDRTDLLATLTGKLITHPYTNPENIVSGAITTAMTGTTSTSLVAAPGSGLRNYITTIIVSNAHATVGTDVVIQDGSGGTTLLTIPAAAVYGGAIITLPVPLRQPTTNTALYCANVTTGASTKVSAVGFKAA